jgi:ethanolamine utilization protein EutN
MRLGVVRGQVVLNPRVESYAGRRLVVIEPMTMGELRAEQGRGSGKSLVAMDELGAANGQLVAFTEGREASNPFWPGAVPVDAYCALIVDSVDLGATNPSSENEVRK